MVDLTQRFDVLVIGGEMPRYVPQLALGWRALPFSFWNGRKNSIAAAMRATRNMRCAHDAATDTLTGPYLDELFEDLLRVTGRPTRNSLGT